MTRELLKQALDNAYDHIQHEAYNDALSSICDALAELEKPEPEPVAWIDKEQLKYLKDEDWHTSVHCHSSKSERNNIALYAAPPQKPLSPQEAWALMPWQEMDSAPKDGTHIMVKDEHKTIYHNAWYDFEPNGQWWAWEREGITINPIAWLPLPLPEQSK